MWEDIQCPHCKNWLQQNMIDIEKTIKTVRGKLKQLTKYICHICSKEWQIITKD